MKLPEINTVRHVETSLDKHLRDRRRLELDRLRGDAQAIDIADVQQAIEELEYILTSLENLAQEVLYFICLILPYFHHIY